MIEPTPQLRASCPATPTHAQARPPARRLRRAGLMATAALAAGLGQIAVSSAAGATELPLVRVVLSSAGLAQFLHAGEVAGGATVELPVRLDQVDDLLKSLTVFDRAGGVGAVSLPGKAPLAELFRDLPFGPEALESPTRLLNALVGAEVEIAGPVTATGRVFRVQPEETQLPNGGGTVTRHRLALMTERGLVSAVLEDLTALRFTDIETRVQIDRALAAQSQNRAKDRRTLSIGFLGDGTRRVGLGYVVAAPVWKTSYRLVLPREGGPGSGKARLQGWAVVENLTGGDWTNVELVLVSGNPVALKQQLYTAFYTDRIEVPVTTAARLLPRTDDADAENRPGPRAKAAGSALARREMMMAPQVGQMQRPMAPALAAPAAAPPPAEPDAIAAAAQAAEAEEASTQLLYRFPARVTVATGHTVMVPFVDREVTASRTWLYQPETSARRPLAAVRLKNDGDTSLPAGIVTAFDGGDGAANFVGDAQLPLLARGTFKYVTFALDAKTDIRREDKGVRRTTLGKAVDGVLTLTTRSRRTLAYEITPPADEDREIVIEEARADGWSPAPDSKDVEETPTRFRATVKAPKGQTTKASLVLERTDRQAVMLTDFAPEEILARIRGLENETPAVKEAVLKLGALAGEINRARAERARLDTERKSIGEDQARLRQNLQAVGSGSDLGRRYLDTLKAQEDRLAEIARAEQRLDAEMAAKRQAAVDVARQLKI
ncbi:hypothetical protein PQJ75_09305 [Rhodoplanes sp. TEM]|uniref:DUF4139 domain-containing protein n=1 Tax=Rhodoplanes tepidamans TaxID=200616 RepID=A0ABT5JCY3_RHOTP|nr:MULTISPECIES: hypothetical protein [Rhodoplanes]MDC7787484.1 hypothetical protein [Rhodoplanes tepidamans]MDC7983925.1 hypothetical protein [Rhodoplanes sp. TEM]MDQ0354364.1 hypothetical protein [Rhodoplanes tepidamans]